MLVKEIYDAGIKPLDALYLGWSLLVQIIPMLNTCRFLRALMPENAIQRGLPTILPRRSGT